MKGDCSILLIQEEMIEIVRRKSRNDRMIVAAMMYGSFTQHNGDEFNRLKEYFRISMKNMD